jgi:hypothetical protein
LKRDGGFAKIYNQFSKVVQSLSRRSP